MAAEANLVQADNLGLLARSIDLANRFGNSIAELLELIGTTYQIKLDSEAIIQTYKWSVTKPASQVGEGQTIPLTKVERKKVDSYEVPFNKYRKATTAEVIRRHGIDMAITQADEKLLREIQRDVVKRFYEFLSKAPTKNTANNLQKALAVGWAKTSAMFEQSVECVSFINAMDVANWMGDRPISAVASTGYGFTLLKDFLATQRVLVFSSVPEGKVYTTAVDNIALASQLVSGNDLARAFKLTTDETGLIGITHSAPKTDTATIETLAFEGSTLFAEVLDGVVETTITPDAPTG